MRMPKKIQETSSDIQEFEGTVLSCLPGAQFRVKLDKDDREIQAYASGSVMKNRIRIVEGDRVLVEISVYDVKRGRIKFRKK